MAVQPAGTDDITAALQTVSSEIDGGLRSIDARQLANTAAALLGASRVYFTGAGRSGIGLHMVAMRFMHLGLDAHVIGEASAPAVSAGDVVIVASSSGNTESIVTIARKTQVAGARIVAVTSNVEGQLYELSDVQIVISAAGKQSTNRSLSAQYAGSLFEQLVLLTFDSLFHAIRAANHVPVEVMWARHANWE